MVVTSNARSSNKETLHWLYVNCISIAYFDNLFIISYLYGSTVNIHGRWAKQHLWTTIVVFDFFLFSPFSEISWIKNLNLLIEKTVYR